MMMRTETLTSFPAQWSRRVPMRDSLSPRTYAAEVIVRHASDGEGMLMDAVRIGPTGMFLRSDVLFEPGETLFLTFPSPTGEPLEAIGEITELDFGELDAGTAGMKVSFSWLPQGDRDLLEASL